MHCGKESYRWVGRETWTDRQRNRQLEKTIATETATLIPQHVKEQFHDC
jgi:hypothetical protein